MKLLKETLSHPRKLYCQEKLLSGLVGCGGLVKDGQVDGLLVFLGVLL